jgi:hydroxymethylpyrimidine pyrophosphatase-like HAD family hydrolase
MRIVIDIDGTLCTEDTPDMTQRQPYVDRIAKLNAMYDDGHEIVIFTSRGMNSSRDDQQASDLKYRIFTENQLKAWGVKYTALFFGKPNADLYIDNKNGLLEEFFK